MYAFGDEVFDTHVPFRGVEARQGARRAEHRAHPAGAAGVGIDDHVAPKARLDELVGRFSLLIEHIEHNNQTGLCVPLNCAPGHDLPAIAEWLHHANSSRTSGS